MSNITRLIQFIVFLSLIGSAHAAHAQSLENRAEFIAQELVSAGAAHLTSPNGGAYVYGPAQRDARRTVEAFPIGGAKRHDYVFFDDQEEAALWAMLQEGTQPNNPEVRRQLVHRTRVHPKILEWPRVVMNGQQVCVPKTQFAWATDWRDHLTCWSKEEGER